MSNWEIFQSIFLLLSLISAGYYAFTHFANIQAWKKIDSFSKDGDIAIEKTPFFSVIIAARNEAINIKACLDSILNQNFAKSNYEVILIDDHSVDETAAVVTKHFGEGVLLLQQKGDQNQGKKAAIEIGIKKAKGAWIVTTDADCIVPENWLNNIAAVIEKSDAVFVGGPVLFHAEESNSLAVFQQLDLIGMMGVTAGGIQRGAAYLANGANLAYQKSAFEFVNGFEGVDHKASGDDMLLLQKIAASFPGKIAFARHPDQVVLTNTEDSWPEFFQQRLRWASKGNAFPNFSTWLQMVLVFAFSSILIFSFLLIPSDPIFFGTLAIALYLTKAASDYFYLGYLCRYFNKRFLISSIWWASPLHALYIFIIGISAQIYQKYEWKGRKVR